MQETQECLTSKLEHQYEWFFTDTGFTLWKCLFCKDIIEENEDCQL